MDRAIRSNCHFTSWIKQAQDGGVVVCKLTDYSLAKQVVRPWAKPLVYLSLILWQYSMRIYCGRWHHAALAPTIDGPWYTLIPEAPKKPRHFRQVIIYKGNWLRTFIPKW